MYEANNENDIMPNTTLPHSISNKISIVSLLIISIYIPNCASFPNKVKKTNTIGVTVASIIKTSTAYSLICSISLTLAPIKSKKQRTCKYKGYTS